MTISPCCRLCLTNGSTVWCFMVYHVRNRIITGVNACSVDAHVAVYCSQMGNCVTIMFRNVFFHSKSLYGTRVSSLAPFCKNPQTRTYWRGLQILAEWFLVGLTLSDVFHLQGREFIIEIWRLRFISSVKRLFD